MGWPFIADIKQDLPTAVSPRNMILAFFTISNNGIYNIINTFDDGVILKSWHNFH